MNHHVSPTRRETRRWTPLFLLLAAVAVTLIVSACAQAPHATPWPTRTFTPVRPTATPYQVASAVSVPVLSERPDSANCVACHTDEEALRAVAEEPEQVETLSEGEG